jgi:hypothetical protein
MSDKNMFGGGNKRSLYTPMSEDEQEVLARLVDARNLDVHILNWGVIRGAKASFGDLRLDIPIQITFNRPEIPQLVSFFDLELRTGSGLLLFKERQSAVYGGNPVAVGAGTCLSMVWHIAIQAMDPKVVKAFKPGARGLTSRWIDRDTGSVTLLGNTKMNSKQKAALIRLRKGEHSVRQDTVLAAKKATIK